MTTASPIVQTIAEQVAQQGIIARNLMFDGDRTLIVHMKVGRTVRNARITLNDHDTYDVAVHTFTSTNVGNIDTKEYEMVYADQLAAVLCTGKFTGQIR